jgi:hypothetical protein
MYAAARDGVNDAKIWRPTAHGCRRCNRCNLVFHNRHACMFHGVSQRVTERTALEVEAYRAWMSAMQLLEAESWALALQRFSTAHSILSQLAHVGTLEEQVGRRGDCW